MKRLIVTAAFFSVALAGETQKRDKRGFISGLGYGVDSSIALSSFSAPALHLPLAASTLVHSEPAVVHSAPVITSYHAPTIIKTIQPAPTIIKTIQPAPIIKTVVAPQQEIIKIAEPQVVYKYVSSDATSVNSAGLLKSYKWGGIPVTGYKTNNNLW